MASPFTSSQADAAGRLRDLKAAVSKSQMVVPSDGEGQNETNPTVAQYIVGLLSEKLGIRHAFGCPGDFAFAFDDAIEENENIQFVVTSNELNASYAADAYARMHGASILTTTHGVGELSAINGVFGAKAERVGALFHLVGEPGLRLQHTGRVLHHTVGVDAIATQFHDIGQQSACVSLRVTDPASVPKDMDRVVECALRNHQPCYIKVPKDIGYTRIPQKALENFTSIFSNSVPRTQLRTICPPISVDKELHAGVSSVIQRLQATKNLVVMASYVIGRNGLESKALALIEKLGAPFVVTTMDKGVLPENHKLYAGMYKGKMSQPWVVELVNRADTILDIGGMLWDDLSTGFGTSEVLKKNVIKLDGNESSICIGDETEQCVQNRARSFRTCYLGDVLDSLLEAPLPSFKTEFKPVSPWPACENVSDTFTYAHVVSVVQHFLRETDIFVCEVGTSSMVLPAIQLPPNCSFISQTLWGSIGYATPAVFGASLACPDQRVVMVTGDGAHQMTANDLGAMGRYGTKPIIVVLNNGVYGVEEFLEKNASLSYNDLADWHYADVAKAMGCNDWIIERVSTVGDLVKQLSRARDEVKGAYIEVMMQEKLLDALTSSALSMEYMDAPSVH